MRRPSLINRRDLFAAVSAASLGFCAPASAGMDLERAYFASLLCPIDVLERLVQQAALSAANSGRYHFDFARLRSDIARMRAGIEDYLSPRRAQPRDPTELSADYRREELAP